MPQFWSDDKAVQRSSDMKGIVRALGATGAPVNLLYNNGNAVIDDSYKPDGHLLIYNAPGANVQFVGKDNTCQSCGRSFGSSSELSQHIRNRH